MMEYTDDELAEIHTDALVLEVNCVGLCSDAASRRHRKVFPENYKAYKIAFDAGEVEPGKLLMVERSAHKPRCIFNFPTKIHWKGETKAQYIESGIDQLTRDVLKLGIKSIAIPILESDRGLDWPEIKLRILSSFARVPEIKIVFFSSQVADKRPKRVAIYGDGGADPNPGAGGFGVVLRFGDSVKELSEGFQLTSNHRMELLAAITGLEALKEQCHVRLHSDSRYVVDAVNHGNLFRLQARNWKSRKARNVDLWKRFLEAYLRHEVEMVWVKGHAGIEDNERCDQLASRAMSNSNLQVDEQYVEQVKRQKQLKKATTTTAGAESDSASQTNSNGRVGPKPKKVGDPCRHCRTPLVRRKTKKSKLDSKYFFAWYLYCENCRRLYHVEEAKIYRDK